MTPSKQSNDITELQPEDTKAVVGGASAIEYGLLAAGVSLEIMKAAPTLAKLAPAPALTKPTK
jgi:hypothetical protein